MAQEIKRNESNAALRRVPFQIVDATDGITPELGEVGGQPQISIAGAVWVNTAGVLVVIGNGRYYVELSQAETDQVDGTLIETRYKSAATAESLGAMVQIIDDVPVSLVAALVESQRGAHTWQGNFFYVDPINGDTHANGARGGRSDPYSLVQDCLDNAVTDSNHDVIFLVAGNTAGATTLTEDVIINKRYTFLRGPGRDFIWTRNGAGDTIAITADGVEVEGVQIFTDSIGVGNGIDIAGADFIKIQKCWLNDTRGDAINISNSDNVQILNNHLQLSGQSGAGHGIVLDSAGGSSMYPIIQGNVIQHVAGDGIKLLGGNVEHGTIKDNVIQDCDGYGINVGGGVVEAFLIDNKLALNDSGDINDNGTNTSLHNNKTTEDAVWDETLTGATHNIPNSAGRRLRNISSIIITDGTCPSAPLQPNQIILNGDAFSTDGAYDPSGISIRSGTGEGQTRNILQYDGATKTATLDRNWKILPDDTSEYIIYADAGREHVNEGLAQAGDALTITLNVLASDDDDAYEHQVIFLRSGTAEDQARRIIAYNGTTKIATVERAWDVVPDATTAYVMLPTGTFHSVDVSTIGGAPISGDAIITGIFQSKVTVREGRDIVVYAGDYPTLELVAPVGWDFIGGGNKVFFKTALIPGGVEKIAKEATVTGATTADVQLTGPELDVVDAYEGEFYQTDADGVSNPLTIARFRLSVRQDV
jgi:hypothetical protein